MHQAIHASGEARVDDRPSSAYVDPQIFGFRPDDVHLGSQVDDRVVSSYGRPNGTRVGNVSQHLW